MQEGPSIHLSIKPFIPPSTFGPTFVGKLSDTPKTKKLKCCRCNPLVLPPWHDKCKCAMISREA